MHITLNRGKTTAKIVSMKLEGFSPVYVINLEDRLDRRKYIEGTFKDHGIEDYTIFKAYDARHLDGRYKMTGGQIGCAMSHLLAIQSWYEGSDSEYAIIAEDDLSLANTQYWDWSWQDLLDCIEFKFDILHLSTWALDLAMPEDLCPVKREPDDLRLLTSCYMISRDGARQILEKVVNADSSITFDYNDEDNIADHKLLYGNVENYYVFPLFSPNVDLISDITESKEVARLQRMAAEHTSWLWRHNIASIQEIMSNYR